MLEGKKIILGISGSIAAYKSVFLVRMLVKAGAEVKVIMTSSARDFVSPLTFSTLSRNEVLTDLATNDNWSNHVMLGRWADLMVIAPLSCNTLAKMANGLCDNLLMAVYLSATCPVVVAPAMDEDMWKHPTTQQNLETLRKYGNKVIPVGNGELASGLVGDGRMAEPEEIVSFIQRQYFAARPLSGITALVTAGPTYEPIDPVRFIGNHSSGKMGIAIAKELHSQGAKVHLVLGPVQIAADTNGIDVIKVKTAKEMLTACESKFQHADLTVMAAAVADYAPGKVEGQKIKKKEKTLDLKLEKTTDILKTLGERKNQGQVLIGFALETTGGEGYALDKLKSKNADMIVLNTLEDEGAGFGHDTNKVTIYEKNGAVYPFEKKSKQEVARDIVATIIGKYYA